MSLISMRWSDKMDTPTFGENSAADAGAGGALIKDTTTQTFMADVIEASKEVPVLVDFWAPWCGPCKQLGPQLEKAVTSAKGAVKMVKMNIDEHPEVAQQLQVQSIPAVFAFKDGQPVDGFMGAVPESQIKSFIERIAGEDAFADETAELEAAEAALEEGKLQLAVELFAALLAKDKQNPLALAGLAKCYVKSSDFDRAKETLDLVPPKDAALPVVASARAMLELAQQAGDSSDLDELRAAVEADPKNHQARFDLALALNSAGKREEALDELIELMTRDRAWNEDGARKQLVQLFEAWGSEDPLTIEGRRN